MTFKEDFKNEGLRVRLTMQEKAALRARLSERMKLNPASPAIQSPYHFFIFNHIMLQRTFAAVLLFVFVLGSGGGTSYAAQGALPGELLYAVKIHINEFVETALATTPTEKAQMQAVLAERRVEEAQTLAARGMLTDGVVTQLQTRFDEHAASAQSLTEALAAIDPGAAAQIGTQLSSSLAANDAVLVSLGDKSSNEETKRTARMFSARVRVQTDAIARTNEQVLADAHVSAPRASKSAKAVAAPVAMMARMAPEATTTSTTTEEKIVEQPATSTQNKQVLGQRIADELKARAMAETDSLMRILSAQETQAAKEKVRAEMESIAVLMSAGNTALGATEYDTAVAKFGQALKKVVALRAYVQAQQNFNSDIVPLIDSLWGKDVDN